MTMRHSLDEHRFGPRRLTRGALALAALLWCVVFTGCAAVTNPVADGIPVRLLPADIVGPSKMNYQTIPLNALELPPHNEYLLDAGDVLGIFVDGQLGDKNIPLPVNVSPLLNIPGQNRVQPSAGYPVPVQPDGTVTLPRVGKVSVRGLTIVGAREAIKEAYVKGGFLLKENDRILVTLMHPRDTRVLVFRQEGQSFLAFPDGPTPTSKRNTGQMVDLPAYHNDVLNALVRSGGLPELDAYNEIVIYRNILSDPEKNGELLKKMEKTKPGTAPVQLGHWLCETTRIPLRVPCGAPLPFSREDVVLNAGDVLFLEARDEEVFYTGGLLPPAKYVLPRDQDLDVIEAILRVRGPFYNGAFGGSNLSGAFLAAGLGSPSPSLCVVVRKVPGRGQVAIRVDLRAALQHPQERLIVRAGDVLILQEKPAEAFARYMTQTFFNFNLFYNVLNSSRGFGIIDIATPDRLPGRVGTLNTLP